MAKGISVVIPSWNGLQLLRETLPSVLAACRRYNREVGSATEIIVVDDGSRDETVTKLPLEFPEVRLVPKDRNEGFAVTCNLGFRQARFPVIALLNNDVRIDEHYLVYHGQHFEDPDAFAVTARVFDWDMPVFRTGGRYGRFRRGLWSVYFNYDVGADAPAQWIAERRLLSAYAIGGFATYCGRKLEQLGGFNELLSPFHWEDVDLSYRGWKRGWEVRYEPRSKAWHKISATIDVHFKKKQVEAASLRNRLLFHWINLHSPTFLVRHLCMLMILALTRIFVLDFDFYRSLAGAIRQLPAVKELRAAERASSVRSDAEVATLLLRFYRAAPIRVYFNQRDVSADEL
jgi:GT2 family glycosyltransferase